MFFLSIFVRGRRADYKDKANINFGCIQGMCKNPFYMHIVHVYVCIMRARKIWPAGGWRPRARTWRRCLAALRCCWPDLNYFYGEFLVLFLLVPIYTNKGIYQLLKWAGSKTHNPVRSCFPIFIRVFFTYLSARDPPDFFSVLQSIYN